MTAPASASGQPSSSASADQTTTEAVQRALAAEHAALWALQLATAFVTAEVAPVLAETTTAHRARRDTAEALLRDRGAVPAAAEPAYAAPVVTDQASAAVLLVTAESDVAAAWRSAIEFTDDVAVRALAADSLTDAAVRATRWRRIAGVAPLTVPFPGTG